jgi:uncharacterized protein
VIEMETTNIGERMANPWVLGLYGLAGATFVVGARMAGWYGSDAGTRMLAPFVALFALLQILAAMWAYERRSDTGTAVLGSWGAFWLGWAILHMPFGGTTPAPAGGSSEIAFWFIVLGAITWMGALAATGHSWALAIALILLAGASTLGAIGDGLGVHGIHMVSGWLFVLGGLVAWYTSTALMLASALGGDEMLPIGRVRTLRATGAATESARAPAVARRVS